MLKPCARHVDILLLAVSCHLIIVIDPFDHVNIHCGLCGEHPGAPCVMAHGQRGVACVRNSFLIPAGRILRGQPANNGLGVQEAQSIFWNIFASISLCPWGTLNVREDKPCLDKPPTPCRVFSPMTWYRHWRM